MTSLTCHCSLALSYESGLIAFMLECKCLTRPHVTDLNHVHWLVIFSLRVKKQVCFHLLVTTSKNLTKLNHKWLNIICVWCAVYGPEKSGLHKEQMHLNMFIVVYLERNNEILVNIRLAHPATSRSLYNDFLQSQSALENYTFTHNHTLTDASELTFLLSVWQI